MKDYYRGKVVVITGASSGIGRDFALLISEWGAKVALVARRKELLEELRAECEGLGGEARVFAGDVSDRVAMEAMRDEVHATWGHADIVIANAGVGGLNPADRFDLDIHRRTVEINLIGLANTLMPFVPRMLERKSGHLVGVSSLAGFRGLPNAASYSSTKASQGVFMESLRVDLRKHGIACTSIHPGFVETPMTDHDEFRMPFKIGVRESSILIARALKRKKRVYLYPWQMKILTWINRGLPGPIYDRLVPRLTGQRKDLKPRML
jgi:short-subunit dehydrogenase